MKRKGIRRFVSCVSHKFTFLSGDAKNSLLGNSMFTSTLFPNAKLSVGVFSVEEGVDLTGHAESCLWSVPKEQGYPTSPSGSSQSV